MGKLISFIVFIVFAVGSVISYSDTTARQTLLKLNTSKERVLYRKIIFKRRIRIICEVASFFVLCLFFTWVMLIVYNLLSEEQFVDYTMWIGGFFIVLAIIIIIAVPIGLFVFMQYRGNLSYLEKDTFLRNNESFVLYLRGFEKDDYSDKYHFSFTKPKEFSEYNFTKVVSKRYLCAAIGMTRELDAPLGAKRIYVDDTTWKDDVADLIDKAKLIFILVNNRPSCIWEIESSVRCLDKTVYIVDNPAKYILVREAVNNTIQFPIIPSLSMNNKFFYLRRENDILKYYEYKNTRKGYQRLFEDVLKNETMNTTSNNYQTERIKQHGTT